MTIVAAIVCLAKGFMEENTAPIIKQKTRGTR
jgi:hypothetical protein